MCQYLPFKSRPLMYFASLNCSSMMPETPEFRVWEKEAPPPPKLPRQKSFPKARPPPRRPCPRRQVSLADQVWREFPREEWLPQVAEEARRQAARGRKDRWAKLFLQDGKRYRLIVRRGGEVKVMRAE
uniref:GG12048 n=1 Tax=Drosophila erecta TaxID=7220 RepID=B3P250_DROER